MFGGRRTNGLAAARQRQAHQLPEDASVGRFNAGFAESHEIREIGGALTIAEAKYSLEMETTADEERLVGGYSKSAVLQKCMDYSEAFSKFKEFSSIQALRKELLERDYPKPLYDDQGKPTAFDENENNVGTLFLTRFEMAQLVNLSIEDVEEAKTLIPTLADKDDGQLEQVIASVSTRRRFQN
ncbi:hypothetical protein IE81DRAFT_321077 [Ceraceosorus guamensis]|uniref:RNA polymerase Rpb4/RPC9 core domain-containing protein n=1 Tax=Ceraceosorus guamensis TaxID=1522189 RepID=A0A316W4A3_9BASI|nr:hypothetical protein IE81DRAFT_321077 [Ceraceosorus guamensis]PWN44757.1 hypothetical protein IE81DRAFT_321077 [Ceraceosorus guamensis]